MVFLKEIIKFLVLGIESVIKNHLLFDFTSQSLELLVQHFV